MPLYPQKPLEILSQDPAKFEAPLAFSSLKEIHKGTNGSLIIHIQDAHSNLSGQENLAKTLDGIMSRYGVSLILVEGGAHDGSLTPIKKIIPKDARQRLAKNLLVERQISGEEYLNLTSDHPMKIVGVEDIPLYAESLASYGKLADRREDALEYLKSIEGALGKLKQKFYPKELLAYDRQSRQNGGDFEAILKGLLGLAEAKNVDLKNFPSVLKLKNLRDKENKIDFKLANLEEAALVEEISKKGGRGDFEEYLKAFDRTAGTKASEFALLRNLFSAAEEKTVPLKNYPNLLLYGDYLKEFAELDLELVLEELAKAEDRIYLSWLPDDNARLIRSIDRYTRLLETAYRIRMSTKEFGLFRANEPDFSTVSYLAFINRKLAESGYFEDLIPYKNILEEGRVALVDFYDSVDKRDVAFVRNTERILKEENQKVAVLITGGYHTPHLRELIREKGYSWAVLTPTVTSETNQKKYEDLLLQPLGKEAVRVETVQGEIRRSDGVRVAFAMLRPGVIEKMTSESGDPLAAAKFSGTTAAYRRELDEAIQAAAPKGARLSQAILPPDAAALIGEAEVFARQAVTEESRVGLNTALEKIYRFIEDEKSDPAQRAVLSTRENRRRIDLMDQSLDVWRLQDYELRPHESPKSEDGRYTVSVDILKDGTKLEGINHPLDVTLTVIPGFKIVYINTLYPEFPAPGTAGYKPGRGRALLRRLLGWQFSDYEVLSYTGSESFQRSFGRMFGFQPMTYLNRESDTDNRLADLRVRRLSEIEANTSKASEDSKKAAATFWNLTTIHGVVPRSGVTAYDISKDEELAQDLKELYATVDNGYYVHEAKEKLKGHPKFEYVGQGEYATVYKIKKPRYAGLVFKQSRDLLYYNYEVGTVGSELMVQGGKGNYRAGDFNGFHMEWIAQKKNGEDEPLTVPTAYFVVNQTSAHYPPESVHHIEPTGYAVSVEVDTANMNNDDVFELKARASEMGIEWRDWNKENVARWAGRKVILDNVFLPYNTHREEIEWRLDIAEREAADRERETERLAEEERVRLGPAADHSRELAVLKTIEAERSAAGENVPGLLRTLESIAQALEFGKNAYIRPQAESIASAIEDRLGLPPIAHSNLSELLITSSKDSRDTEKFSVRRKYIVVDSQNKHKIDVYLDHMYFTPASGYDYSGAVLSYEPDERALIIGGVDFEKDPVLYGKGFYTPLLTQALSGVDLVFLQIINAQTQTAIDKAKTDSVPINHDFLSTQTILGKSIKGFRLYYVESGTSAYLYGVRGEAAGLSDRVIRLLEKKGQNLTGDDKLRIEANQADYASTRPAQGARLAADFNKIFDIIGKFKTSLKDIDDPGFDRAQGRVSDDETAGRAEGTFIFADRGDFDDRDESESDNPYGNFTLPENVDLESRYSGRFFSKVSDLQLEIEKSAAMSGQPFTAKTRAGIQSLAALVFDMDRFILKHLDIFDKGVPQADAFKDIHMPLLIRAVMSWAASDPETFYEVRRAAANNFTQEAYDYLLGKFEPASEVLFEPYRARLAVVLRETQNSGGEISQTRLDRWSDELESIRKGLGRSKMFDSTTYSFVLSPRGLLSKAVHVLRPAAGARLAAPRLTEETIRDAYAQLSGSVYYPAAGDDFRVLLYSHLQASPEIGKIILNDGRYEDLSDKIRNYLKIRDGSAELRSDAVTYFDKQQRYPADLGEVLRLLEDRLLQDPEFENGLRGFLAKNLPVNRITVLMLSMHTEIGFQTADGWNFSVNWKKDQTAQPRSFELEIRPGDSTRLDLKDRGIALVRVNRAGDSHVLSGSNALFHARLIQDLKIGGIIYYSRNDRAPLVHAQDGYPLIGLQFLGETVDGRKYFKKIEEVDGAAVQELIVRDMALDSDRTGARLSPAPRSDRSLRFSLGLGRLTQSSVRDVAQVRSDEESLLLLAKAYISRSRAFLGPFWSLYFAKINRNALVQFSETDGKIYAVLYSGKGSRANSPLGRIWIDAAMLSRARAVLTAGASSQIPIETAQTALSDATSRMDDILLSDMARLIGKSFKTLDETRTAYSGRTAGPYKMDLAIDLRMSVPENFDPSHKNVYEGWVKAVRSRAGGNITVQFAKPGESFSKVEGAAIINSGVLNTELLAQAKGHGISAVSEGSFDESASSFIPRIVLAILIQRTDKPTQELRNLWDSLRSNPLIDLDRATFLALKEVKEDATTQNYKDFTIKVARVAWDKVIAAAKIALRSVAASA